MKTLVNTPASELVSEALALAVDGYSADRYSSWEGVALALIADGWSVKQSAAIMLSKWTRWAADMSDDEYGSVPASAVIAYLKTHTQGDFERLVTEVNELTSETFPNG